MCCMTNNIYDFIGLCYCLFSFLYPQFGSRFVIPIAFFALPYYCGANSFISLHLSGKTVNV